VNGWAEIRDDDRGRLWRHLVLDALRAYLPANVLHFWRDKSHREIDFVVTGPDDTVHTIECKINPDRYRADHLAVFRGLYPSGRNLVVCPFVKEPYRRRHQHLTIDYVPLNAVATELR